MDITSMGFKATEGNKAEYKKEEAYRLIGEVRTE